MPSDKTESNPPLDPLDGAARPGEILITAEGERALRERLDRLRTDRYKEHAERLRDARDFGEAGANDEYLAILEDDALIELQIARLETLLARARVVDDGDVRNGTVTVGTAVVVEDQRTLAVEEFSIVGALENGGAGTVTTSSPIGQALMGREVGDVVRVELPSGAVRELRIRGVEAGGAPVMAER